MMLAVLADVHGNLPALQAVLSELDRLSLDEILVAGDIAGGPHGPEAVALLRERDCIMILGNGEINHLRYAQGLASGAWYRDRQFATHRWLQARLTPELLAFFEDLPEQRVITLDGTDPIRLVHGSPRGPNDGLSPDLELEALQSALAQIAEPVLVCGHTHVPWQWKDGGKLALNPGAVAGGLNGDVRAQYALLEWQGTSWQVEHHAVPYDLARIRRDFEETGFLEAGGHLVRAWLLSIETGMDVSLDFLQFAYRLAQEACEHECETIPDEIWEQAGSSFPWETYHANND